jgi:peptide deformylase
MILPVVHYGHPVLRAKGKRVDPLAPEIRNLIDDMYETMHAAHGIGLAAQQVAETVQVTVIDVRGVKDRPSTLEVNGMAVDVEAFMPLVLVNPELRPLGEWVTGPEGCLSFPEIYADVTRPAMVDVAALNREGQPLNFRCGGLLARAIQHETDHLQGILFIDRMSRKVKEEIQPELDRLQSETKAAFLNEIQRSQKDKT